MNALPFTPAELEARLSQAIIHESWTIHEGAWLRLNASAPQVDLLAPTHHPFLARFPAPAQPFDSAYVLMSAPANHETLAALRGMLAWLNPQPLGLKRSFGFGDRLGLATRGHVLALQRTHAAYPHADIAPIFAQQSIREMARTARDPQQVMADAVWGIFAVGWRDAWGADADHLKTPDDIDRCAAQGFTFFTLDPSAFVQDQADSLDGEALESAALALDWARLETTYHETQQRYANRRFEVSDTYLSATPQEVARASVKYGGAIGHVSLLYRHLAGLNRPFETVLREYQPQIHAALEHHAAAYAEGLAQHFSRHLTPIAASHP